MDFKSFMRSSLDAKKTTDFMDGNKINMSTIMDRGGFMNIYQFKIIKTATQELVAVDIGDNEWIFAPSQLARILIDYYNEYHATKMDEIVKVKFESVPYKDSHVYNITDIE